MSIVYEGTISIDDAGTPGSESSSAYIDESRKSWAAVIVPTSCALDVDRCLDIFLQGVKEDFGADELHFSDIYGGRGVFTGIEPEKRVELFDLMGSIFESFNLPVFFQTMSKAFRDEFMSRANFRPTKAGQWNFQRVEHLGLFFLCCELKKFFRANKKSLPEPLLGLIDEGLVKAGSSFFLGRFDEVFIDGRLHSVRSIESPRVQLADFAAFCISRVQWLASNASALRPLDRPAISLMNIAAKISVMNLDRIQLDPATFTVEDYDDVLELDRMAKGLPPRPR